MVLFISIYKNMKIDKIKKDLLEIISSNNINKNEIMPFSMEDYHNFFIENFPELYFVDKYNKIFFRGHAIIDNGWNSIPSNYFSMIILKVIKDSIDEKLTLCDMGCGIGNVVFFSEKIGYKSMGIEMQQVYNEHYKKYNINVINDNLLNIDYSFLKDIDVVYIYRPIINKDIMQEVINKIYDNMKINSFLYFENGENLNFSKFEPILMNFKLKNLMIKIN